tara:strand:- start:11797 stop:12327 length:531 start_codon:yes stop_codon:yes gene_type:complete
MPEIIPNYHPVLVHFTIALITTSLGTLILGWLLARCQTLQQECFIVSRWCLWLGGLFSILTISAGFYAYYTVAHDAISHRVMTTHRNFALTTFGFIWIMVIWSWLLWIKALAPKWIYAAGMTITFGFMITTGWYGSELVYRYGIGVRSLPQAEETGHTHTNINPDNDFQDHGQHEH